MNITPRRGVEFWSKVPPDVECKRCLPKPGYGHKSDSRPNTRKKLRRSKLGAIVIEDIIGPCDYCQGTGITPIPLTEVCPWFHAWWKKSFQ